MANTTIAVLTPRTATISASSTQALDAAVKVQNNALVQNFLDPVDTGNPVGVVRNGSIRVSDTRLASNSQAVTWYATIFWDEYLIPS
jgi:hypothetical protein